MFWVVFITRILTLILFIFPCIKKFKAPQHCRHSSKTPRSIQYYKTEQQKGQTSSSYRSSSILQNTAFYGSLCVIPVFQFCSQKATKHHNPFPLDSNSSDWNRPASTCMCVILCRGWSALPVPTPSARRGYASFRRPRTTPSVLPGGTPVPFNTLK